MFSSLFALVGVAITGFVALLMVALATHKYFAVSLLGIGGTAAASYVLVLINPAGAGELGTLWPLLLGLGIGAAFTAIYAADLPDLPRPFDTRPGDRVVNATTTSPEAVAAQPAPHWALG